MQMQAFGLEIFISDKIEAGQVVSGGSEIPVTKQAL